MTEVKSFAFVLMPFDGQFQDLYKYGIKETAKEVGIIAERVDEQHYTEQILDRIYRQIESSDFIIAEMTGRNANVFYEVGYAHAKSKLCILVTQKPDDIPFDLKHHPHIIYDGSISDLRQKFYLNWNG
jgi:nucleoside 2-deoxyribosyltransferase